MLQSLPLKPRDFEALLLLQVGCAAAVCACALYLAYFIAWVVSPPLASVRVAKDGPAAWVKATPAGPLRGRWRLLGGHFAAGRARHLAELAGDGHSKAAKFCYPGISPREMSPLKKAGA